MEFIWNKKEIKIIRRYRSEHSRKKTQHVCLNGSKITTVRIIFFRELRVACENPFLSVHL